MKPRVWSRSTGSSTAPIDAGVTPSMLEDRSVTSMREVLDLLLVLCTGGRGAGGPPCVPSVWGPPRGGVPQPIYYLLFTYTYHVLPASTATFCFVCSTCDAAMDLLSAHATRLAPEQARLAPTAPHCVATGAWDKWLADHPASAMLPR